MPCICIYFNDLKLNSFIWWIGGQIFLCVVWAQIWVDYLLYLLVVEVLTKSQLRKKKYLKAWLLVDMTNSKGP